MAQVPELYGILLILVKVKLFIVNLCMFDIRKAFDTNIIAVAIGKQTFFCHEYNK